MTKPLDPEIKALQAVWRAIHLLDPLTQQRVLRWALRRFDVDAAERPVTERRAG
jgi:hypothetical protein